MRYRVTRACSLSGPVKADYAYGVGDIVDDETAPEGHIDRLKAVGALEEIKPASSRRRRPAAVPEGAAPEVREDTP